MIFATHVVMFYSMQKTNAHFLRKLKLSLVLEAGTPHFNGNIVPLKLPQEF